MSSNSQISYVAPDIEDRASSMMAAAFLGVALYLCVELNIRLFFRATGRSLYFWSCLLCSWGLIVHGMAIVTANFNIWTAYAAIVVIELAWLTYVVAQSLVLYSRLNLVLRKKQNGRYILYMIIVNSVIFGLGTVVLGMVAVCRSSAASYTMTNSKQRHPRYRERLQSINLVWDRIQITAFFIQETLIGILYIVETKAYLKNMELLGRCRRTTRSSLHQLIAVNVLIILLDCSVLVLCYGGYFFLQGFYKVAVYAIKLRVEFTILNQLRKALAGPSTGVSGPPVQRPAAVAPVAVVPHKTSDVVEVDG